MKQQDSLLHEFPVLFWGIFKKGITIYKQSFLSYLILTLITFLPFLIFDTLIKFDIFGIIKLFHGNFLDIIIFLTLPTVFTQRKVYPMATIQLFMQRFFLSSAIIIFIQLVTILFFSTLVGFIPYIFFMFAGFFLIMENSPASISIQNNLINSIRLVKSRFFPLFWNYLSISFLIVIPFVLIVYAILYFNEHPSLINLIEAFEKGSADKKLIDQHFWKVIDAIIEFKETHIVCHVVFRPIKSLFLAFLFLGIINQITPGVIRDYLGVSNGKENLNETSHIDNNLDLH